MKLSILLATIVISLSFSCRKSDSCYNGILDQNEVMVDCGGPCFRCIPDSVYGLSNPTRLEERLEGSWIQLYQPTNSGNLLRRPDSLQIHLYLIPTVNGFLSVQQNTFSSDTSYWSAVSGILTLGSNTYHILSLSEDSLEIRGSSSETFVYFRE